MKRKIWLYLLCTALMFGGVTQSAFAQAVVSDQNGSGGQPTIKIIANKVINTGQQVSDSRTMEVSLQVENAEKMASGHASLKYDTTKLQLKQWGKDGGAIVPNDAMQTAGTMAPGAVSGKPSLVYKPKPTGASGGNGSAASGGAGSDSETSDYAYLYLGAASENHTLETGREIVTVQFSYNGGLTADKLNCTELGITETDSGSVVLSVAQEGEFEGFPTYGYPLTLNVSNGTQRYVMTAGELSQTQISSGYQKFPEANLSWSLTDGESLYNNGTITSGDSSGDYAITFFDWDGSVIDAIAVSTSGAIEAVNQFTDTLLAASDSALNTKKGYTFDQWLTVRQTREGLAIQQNAEENSFSSNDEALSSTASAIAAFDDLEELAYVSSGTRGSKGILVQAAYWAENISKTDASYTIEPIEYNRYGSSNSDTDGQYSVVFSVKRENQAGEGVLRTREPGVQVYTFSPDSQGSLVNVKNMDETTFEVVPSKSMKSITVKFVDLSGVASWPNAPTRSGLPLEIENLTFVSLGSLGYINKQGLLKINGDADSQWDSYVDVIAIKDATKTSANPGGIQVKQDLLETVKTEIIQAIGTGGSISQQQLIEIAAKYRA